MFRSALRTIGCILVGCMILIGLWRWWLAPALQCQPRFVLKSQPIRPGSAIPNALLAQILIEGEQREVQIDTGSVYLLLGSPDNQATLSCSSPAQFSYAEGSARYCPTSVTRISALAEDGSYQPLPLRDPSAGFVYGQARFDSAFGGAPYGVLGLAGRLNRDRQWPMPSTMDQLQREFLSVEFRQGAGGDALLSFCPLPRPPERSRWAIPLVSPGSLEYGYCAELLELQFYEKDRATPALILSSDAAGVSILEPSTGHREQIAERWLSFFDLGTTDPLLYLSGDFSLMGHQESQALLSLRQSRRLADRITLVLRDIHGRTIALEKNATVFNQAMADSPTDQIRIPEPTDFPQGLKNLAVVVGLNMLNQYDLEIQFGQDRRANTLVLYERAPGEQTASTALEKGP
jgi:hypothetical protein